MDTVLRGTDGPRHRTAVQLLRISPEITWEHWENGLADVVTQIFEIHEKNNT